MARGFAGFRLRPRLDPRVGPGQDGWKKNHRGISGEAGSDQ